MRRYVIIVIALVALFTTSCKSGHGSMYRQPIDIGIAIAQKSHECIYNTNGPIMIALLCNAYYSTEDEAVRQSIEELFDNMVGVKIHRNETKSSIFLTFKGSDDLFYRINTNEGLLSDGYTWVIGESYTITFTPKDEGVEVVVDIPEYYGYPGNASFMVEDISYDIEEGLNYTLSGNINIFYGKVGTNLQTTIIEPLSYSTMIDSHPSNYSYTIVGFHSGAVDAIYYDAVSNIYDNVQMVYSDSRYIIVSYLDYTGEMTYH